ncbi:MAG: TonB-dependent receptor [Rhodoferax sp.]
MFRRLFRARPSALSCAIACAFPSVWAQSQALPEVQLKEVVVTATRFEESARTVPYSVSVIEADEIRASGASSANEAIARLLGIPASLDTSGGGNASVDLRGFGATADRNQVVVVDGRRLRLDDLSATNLALVPIETVERIEVIRGSGTVQYGEGATGGVIVITTKAGKGVERRNGATLGVRAGSHALREAYGSATLAAGAWSVDVSGKDSKSNGHRDNFASTNNKLQATVQWSNDWLRLGASTGRQMVQSGWPGSLTDVQFAADASQAASLVNKGSSKTEHAGVFVQALLEEWELAADVNTQTKTIRNYWGSAYGADVSTVNGNLRARHSAPLGAAHNVLALGLDTAQWANMGTSGTLSDAQSAALYLTEDVTLPGGQTHVNVGVRSEAVDKKRSGSAARASEHPVAWNLGASHALAQALHAYARLGSSYRLPTADEYTFVVAGAPLQMQTSRDAELGLRWGQARTTVELRWYRHEMQNELGYDPSANGPYGAGTGANVNFDPTRHQGLELEWRQELDAQWALRANLVAREARFVAGAYAGKDMKLVSPRTAALGARWTPGAGHSVDASVHWVDRAPADFQNSCSVPAYTTVDTRYAYAAKSWEWSLGVKNLTDRKYYTLAYSCTGAGNPSSIYPEAGRSVVLGLEIKL